MGRVASSEVFEAEELLEEVDSWSDEEIEKLPKFYREKAREFQRVLTNSGEGERPSNFFFSTRLYGVP
jgi:hypothetical protein